MCRWVLYKGDPLLIADIVTRPTHSLVDQSHNQKVYTPAVQDSKLYNAEQRRLRDHPINGDGWGLGWYNLSFPGNSHKKTSKQAETPSLIRGVKPPWSDHTLHEIAEVITTSCLFAHVRAATLGGDISEQNCHPFRVGKFMFMHNGGIAGFKKIKQKLIARLRPDVFEHVRGSTDSEYAFALFVNHFPPQGIHGVNGRFISKECREQPPYDWKLMAYAMRNTILQICELQAECGIEEKDSHSSLNFAVTDGNTVIATRVRTHPQEDPPSLYFAYGADFLAETDSSEQENDNDNDDNIKEKSCSSTSTLEKTIVVDASGHKVLRIHQRPDSNNTDRRSKIDTLIIASEPANYVATVEPEINAEDMEEGSVLEETTSFGSWKLIPKDCMVIATHNSSSSRKEKGDKKEQQSEQSQNLDFFSKTTHPVKDRRRNSFVQRLNESAVDEVIIAKLELPAYGSYCVIDDHNNNISLGS